eukprot:768006-Hanusia_phi.AAC.4
MSSPQLTCSALNVSVSHLLVVICCEPSHPYPLTAPNGKVHFVFLEFDGEMFGQRLIAAFTATSALLLCYLQAEGIHLLMRTEPTQVQH